jgi:hypothetical protein
VPGLVVLTRRPVAPSTASADWAKALLDNSRTMAAAQMIGLEAWVMAILPSTINGPERREFPDWNDLATPHLMQ